MWISSWYSSSSFSTLRHHSSHAQTKCQFTTMSTTSYRRIEVLVAYKHICSFYQNCSCEKSRKFYNPLFDISTCCDHPIWSSEQTPSQILWQCTFLFSGFYLHVFTSTTSTVPTLASAICLITINASFFCSLQQTYLRTHCIRPRHNEDAWTNERTW